MRDSDIRTDLCYLGPGKGSGWHVVHVPTGKSVARRIGNSSSGVVLGKLLAELADMVAPEGIALERSWLTPTVRSLAETIHTDSAFDRLPILADALEDAGCTSREILDHCRQPGEHVRGCWVIDLVLGKE